jgi:hypothetical protein
MSVPLPRLLVHPALPPAPRKEELNPRRSSTQNHHLTTLMMVGPASAAHFLTLPQWMRAVSAKRVGTKWWNSPREAPQEKLKVHEKRGTLDPASDAEKRSFQQLQWCTESYFKGLKWLEM